MAAKSYTIDEVEVMFDKVIDLIKFEKMPLNKALKEPDTPAAETFYKWLDDDELKAKRYARACEARADLIFEEIIEIADNTQDGTTTKETERGVEITTGDMIQHRRLQVDARKWVLAKMNPKKYGEKLDVTTNDEGLNDRPQFIFVDKSGKKKK